MIGALLARWSPWRVPERRVDRGEDRGRVVAEAEDRRRDAFATRGEVDVLSRSLRAHGARNHFGESLERIYGRS